LLLIILLYLGGGHILLLRSKPIYIGIKTGSLIALPANREDNTGKDIIVTGIPMVFAEIALRVAKTLEYYEY